MAPKWPALTRPSAAAAPATLIALNIEAMQPLAEFNTRMEVLIAQIKSVPLAQGSIKSATRGEIEARNAAQNRRDGLALLEDTLRDLAKSVGEYALQDELPF